MSSHISFKLCLLERGSSGFTHTFMARQVLKASLAVAAVGATIYLDGGKKKESLLSRKAEKISLSNAIQVADKLCEQVKNESGAPGLVVAVSVDGVPVYQKGSNILLLTHS